MIHPIIHPPAAVCGMDSAVGHLPASRPGPRFSIGQNINIGTLIVTTQVVGCGSRNPQVGDQACWFCGESLEHIPALLFCR